MKTGTRQAGPTMWSRSWSFLVLLTLLVQQVRGAKPPVCQLVYGIRINSAGSVEKVLDAARCQNADATFIQSFLEQLKPQLGVGNLLELEISHCNLSSLAGPESLARIQLRRLSIQHSHLERLAVDSLAGQENVLEELDLSSNRLEEIPTAIRNLTALVRLDLSRNGIRSLPQGSVFFHLLKLRHINLNYNRLGYLDTVRYPAGVVAGQTLPLAIFNLEPLREHIETIQLRWNNMTAFPDQFSRPFGRLRYLDLSSNNLLSIPFESFAQMPHLERLQLDNNKLDKLPALQLPVSLTSISIRGNPVRCNCDAVWLWQWSQVQTSRTDGAELELDDCVHPERWRGRHLSSLPPDFCQSSDNDTSTSETTEAINDDVDLIIKSVVLDAMASSDEMNVTLLISGNISTVIQWTLSYRRFASGQTLSPAFTGTLSGNISRTLVGLTSSTGYQVCVQLVGRVKSQQHHRCLEVTTLPDRNSSYPVAEVAVAASVSTSTTLVVVILVCCCCPRIKCGKKSKKNKNTSTDGSTNGQVDQKNPILTFSSGVDAESNVIWSGVEQFQPAHFSTFRGHTSGKKHSRPILATATTTTTAATAATDPSHQVFQATCNYLRQRAMDPSRGLANRNESQLMQLVQPHRSSYNQIPVYLAPLADGPVSGTVGSPRMIQQANTVHYFNSSYGLTEFHPGQVSGPTTMPDHPSKYCTWRPPSKKPRPLLSSWTSYPDFLANSGSFQHPLPPHQPAVAVPLYSLTTSGRPKRKRDRFYWTAAPAPIHTVEMQF